jgi:hypothetical protein
MEVTLMAKTVKDKFKVVKVEEGHYDYNTVFIEVNKNTIQIPIRKSVLENQQILNKTILIPCELVGDNEYLFNGEIVEVEFV